MKIGIIFLKYFIPWFGTKKSKKTVHVWVDTWLDGSFHADFFSSSVLAFCDPPEPGVFENGVATWRDTLN